MEKQQKTRAAGWIKGAAAVVFWILVWQCIVIVLEKKGEMSMGGSLLVASPAETGKALFSLLQTADFWKAVGGSFVKIASGFFLALGAGVLCAVLACVSGVVRALLHPVFRLIKAVPVASFIILALFWLSSSKNLSVLISFLMVLPVIYTNVLQGIEATDRELLEMASVFRVSFGKRIRYIYIPAVLPYFVSACSVGLGFCFKSGIAAEVIGQPQNSIGERLYDAKLYLLTEELFAWTAVIILVSVVFEKAVMLLVKALAKGLAGGRKQTEQPPDDTAGEGSVVQERAAGTQGALTKSAEALPGNPAPKEYGLYEVAKRFEDKTVLERFSLTIKEGEIVALMGASGCGKSTAGKVFLGLLQADGGCVRRPKRMGAVFQEDRLCKEFDAVTNIAMVTGNRKTAQEALAKVGLSGIGKKPVAALSGGMKRRVAIVRALLSDGEVLVLDEPFTGLDVKSKQDVMRYVKENLHGRSALLITHNGEEAAYLADRVVNLVR